MKAHEFIRKTFELNNKISINELPNLPVSLVVQLLNNYTECKVKKLPIPDANGSTFETLTNCPKCGSDEVYQYTKDKDKCLNCNHIWYLYAPFKGI